MLQPALPVMIHIGYHKTGTTWLQQHVFASRLGVFDDLDSKARIAGRLVPANPFAFDASTERTYFHARVKRAQARGLHPVVTCERLAGTPHAGGSDSREIADRLLEVFGPCRILIGIREQQAVIVSAYKQFVRAGGTLSITDYVSEIASGNKRVPRFRAGYYEYHWLIDYYQRRFGKDRVLVIPQEMLSRDAAGVTARIAAFAGVSLPPAAVSAERRNTALGGLTVAVRRRVNRWAGRDAVNPSARWRNLRLVDAIDRSTTRFTPGWLQEMADRRLRETVRPLGEGRFAASNRITAHLTGLNLGELGYEWDSPAAG